jgi:hypothetical protein
VNDDETFLDEIIRAEPVGDQAKGDDPRRHSLGRAALSVGTDTGRSLQCCDHLETSRNLSDVLGLVPGIEPSG